jgi:hypothetical protein
VRPINGADRAQVHPIHRASNWQNSLAGDGLANAFLERKMGAKGTGSIIERENRA